MQAKSNAMRIASHFAGMPVLIVGDIMLDEYIWGTVHRISPEAPVPVVQIDRRTFGAGGAANVAANVVSMGGDALLCGVVGQDAQAASLRSALRDRGVAVDGLVIDVDRPTTTKTRIIAHSQQVVRVDAEKRASLSVESADSILDWVATHISKVAACVLSDYDKGVVSPKLAAAVVGMARQAGKPVVVDPKGSLYAKYQGATVITPNVQEAARAANHDYHDDDDLQTISCRLLDLLHESALIITRGPRGMSLYVDGRTVTHIPTVARNVFDVTGAGDTVVGTLALALGTGASLKDAAYIANRAAGIVVGKVGAATITLNELLECWSDD